MFGLEMVIAYFIIAAIGWLIMRTRNRAAVLKSNEEERIATAKIHREVGFESEVISALANTFAIGCCVFALMTGTSLFLCCLGITYAVLSLVCYYHLRSLLPLNAVATA